MQSGAKTYPYHFHIALDGSGINGLEGMAGTCLFLFNPIDNSYAYKICYYDGIAAGHAVSVNPAGTFGFLGNAGQHIHIYDASNLAEVERISTLRFEAADTTIRGTTHLVWLSNEEFIAAVGDYFYRFHLSNLARGERIGEHKVKLPHALKLTASGRYLCYGSMDNPDHGVQGEAKEVGIFDLKTGVATRIPLPTTCWHLACHPKQDIFYCVSFRVLPQGGNDWHEWGMAYRKEYAFEVDAPSASIVRHWSAAREVPAHINSDITLSDTELIFCNGASQTIVCIDLASFSHFRVIDERPSLAATLLRPREAASQFYDALARGAATEGGRHLWNALRASRFSVLDSIYACQLSADQTLLFTANRGLNHITVYDYPSATVRLRIPMPPLQQYSPMTPLHADPRLGFHHSYLISPPASPAAPVVSSKLAAA